MSSTLTGFARFATVANNAVSINPSINPLVARQISDSVRLRWLT